MQSALESAPPSNPAYLLAPKPAASGNLDEIVHLHFDWQDLHIDAQLERRSVRESLLQVHCDLGPLPFTAEGVSRRTNMFAVLDATRNGLQVRTKVSRNQRINLVGEMKLPAPITTQILITGIATLLSLARPYTELIGILQGSADSVRHRH